MAAPKQLHTPAPHALWALRAAVFVGGAVAGWFAGIVVNRLLGAFFRGFNWVFDVTINVYGRMVAGLLRVSAIALLVYGGLMGLTYLGLPGRARRFHSGAGQGLSGSQCPTARRCRLDRTDKIVREMSKIAREVPGVAHTIDLPGYSAVLGTNISNVGGMFVILEPFEERAGKPELSAPAIMKRLREKFSAITAARVGVFGAPPVEGLGTTGGFKLQVQDRRSAGLRPCRVRSKTWPTGQPRSAAGRTVHAASASPSRSSTSKSTRKRPRPKQIKLKDIDATLQAYLGSFYVNDFFFQNRNWQVNVQAAPRYRMKIEDIGNLEVRNGKGQPRAAAHADQRAIRQRAGDRQPLQPLSRPPKSTAARRPASAPARRSTSWTASPTTALPDTMGFEWTELTYQQILASKDCSPSWRFRWPSCSCSWCLPRSTKAGRCRCRSS